MRIYTSEAPKGIDLDRVVTTRKNHVFQEGIIVGRYLMQRDLMPIVRHYEKQVTDLKATNRLLMKKVIA